jgi:hypothetical protein
MTSRSAVARALTEIRQRSAARTLQRAFRTARGNTKRARMTRLRRGRMPQNKYNEHSYKRYTDVLPVDITGTTYALGLVFKLEDVNGATDFADLYDRYMITTVVLKFKLVTNPDSAWGLNNATGTIDTRQGTNWFPKLWYCPDYDDNSSETLAQLKERSQTKWKVLRPNKEIKIVVKPAVTIQTYRTATTTGYAPKWKQWIDMAQRDVPHYGLKFVVDGCGLDPSENQPFKMEIDRRYYFTCKDVR